MNTLDVQTIVQKYVDAWNDSGRDQMWVNLAAPGDHLNIPGVEFGSQDSAHAGMELPIRAHLIVLNKAMRTESLLTTFLHEYGHALYRVENPGNFDSVESEVSAIRHSLKALDAEGLPELARQEAAAVMDMTSSEPYRSAVERLKGDPLWQKYAT
jgi:hypothetical protein